MLKADGFIVNPGITRLLDGRTVSGKKLIVRSSIGGSKFSDYKTFYPAVVSAESLLDLGAYAAILMLVLGDHDYDSVENVARAIDEYHSLSIPVVVEVLAEDFSKTSDPDLVKTGARIAAELGADVLKVFYTEDFDSVVQCCLVPVMLAGGPRNLYVLTMARSAVNCGARGFVFGRNVFQSEELVKLIAQLDGIIRG